MKRIWNSWLDTMYGIFIVLNLCNHKQYYKIHLSVAIVMIVTTQTLAEIRSRGGNNLGSKHHSSFFVKEETLQAEPI